MFVCAWSCWALEASQGAWPLGNNIMVPLSPEQRKRKAPQICTDVTVVSTRGPPTGLRQHPIQRRHPRHHVLAYVAMVHPGTDVVWHHVSRHHLRRRKQHDI